MNGLIDYITEAETTVETEIKKKHFKTGTKMKTKFIPETKISLRISRVS